VIEEERADVSQEETEGQVQETGQNQEEQQEDGSAEDQTSEETQDTFDRPYVENLRAESARYRTRAQTAEKRVEQLEAARGTADEQLRTENETLRTQNETLLGQIRRAAFIEAIKLPSPRLAYASLADAGVEVEWNEDNRPTNLADIRKALKREFPREFGDGSADGGDRTVNANGYQGKPGLDRLRHGYETNQRE
jgi:hypothetical protein